MHLRGAARRLVAARSAHGPATASQRMWELQQLAAGGGGLGALSLAQLDGVHWEGARGRSPS